MVTGRMKPALLATILTFKVTLKMRSVTACAQASGTAILYAFALVARDFAVSATQGALTGALAVPSEDPH